MRIAIAGAHGVGKTTLSHTLNRLFPNSMIVPDLARSCQLPTGLESTHSAQDWIMSLQLRLEHIYAKAGSVTFFDHCSLSHYAYYSRVKPDATTEERAAGSTSAFDLILYVHPTEGFLVDDGLRPTDRGFQKEIIDLQLELFHRNRIAYHDLPDGWHRWSPQVLKDFVNSKLPNPANEESRNVAVALVRRDDRILMIRRNMPFLAGAHEKWDLPGGSVEHGEKLGDAAIRETFEETGYLVETVDQVPKMHQATWTLPDKSKLHVNVFCFECRLVAEHPVDVNSDNKVSAVEWIPQQGLSELDTIHTISDFLEIE